MIRLSAVMYELVLEVGNGCIIRVITRTFPTSQIFELPVSKNFPVACQLEARLSIVFLQMAF